MTIDDEILMAYADGELETARVAEVERLVAADPELARRVAEHRALSARLAGVHASALTEPLPDSLVQTVMGGAAQGEVVAFKPRRLLPAALPQWAALAATLVVGVVAGLGVPALRPAPLIGGDGMTAQGQLAQALDSQLASEPAGARRIAVGLSFRTADAYCRTFQAVRAHAVSGIACREADGWRVRLAVDRPAAPQPDGDYRLAASGLPTEVLQAVDGMIQGDPLDAQGEAKARAQNWRLP